MGKRSDFQRVERDFYPTPYEAVVPLLKHLPKQVGYTEPCAGDKALVRHLNKHGHLCLFAGDVEIRAEFVHKVDATNGYGSCAGSMFITNPPWDRKILHPIIEHLSGLGPTWLLFDADWMHTKQASSYLSRLVKVVSVGRVKWIPGSKMTGKDNCCWYLFDAKHSGTTEFYGRKDTTE